MIRRLLLWLLRKTEMPYDCYWRDRAFRAENALRKIELDNAMEIMWAAQRRSEAAVRALMQ